MQRMNDWFRGNGFQKYDIVYTDALTGREFVYKGRTFNEGWSVFEPVNEFKPLDGKMQKIRLNWKWYP